MPPVRSSMEHGYWRSLRELARQNSDAAGREDEFHATASTWPNELSRRDFIRLGSATLALAGLSSCTKQPVEKIVPYVKQPEEIVPGKPLRFATATQFRGFGQGLVVTSYEGRPTKIEGNPQHPASLGATSIWAQADILDLYDPDRAQTVTTTGATRTSEDFWDVLSNALAQQTARSGAGLRILTERTTSPTLLAQMGDVLRKYPGARWSMWDATSGDTFNSPQPLWDFSKANTVVALDSDFLYAHPFALRYARDFANGRRIIEAAPHLAMNRLFVAEPTPTITGSNADHRLRVAAGDMMALAQAIASQVGAGPPPGLEPRHARSWINDVVRSLQENRGRSIVLTGETQPLGLQLLVRQINAVLGNEGNTVLSAPAVPLPARPLPVGELVSDMAKGAVELLIIIGGNPVYDAPADFGFAPALDRVKLRVHHSVSFNETSRLSHWHVPAAHFLETWSDTRAFDGTVSIVQPLIEPMYGGISAHQILEGLSGQSPRSSYDILRSRWETDNRVTDFEQRWRRALSAGVITGLSTPAVTSGISSSSAQGSSPTTPSGSSSGLEIVFREDVNVLDGRYSNNGWLQELPRQFSKLVWDNAALVSPEVAGREKLQNGDVIELTFRGRTIQAPVWIQPGQAENSVTLPLGYGREIAGRVGDHVGFNAYALRTSDALSFGDGASIRKTGRVFPLVTTQEHHSVGDRGILHDGTFEQFVAEPRFAQQAKDLPPIDDTLYRPNEYPYTGYKWGMVVDLNVCIGCQACTIACQAENNIPVVGKEQVAVHRQMHWIRVDTYYAGSESEPAITHQPVPCMHCENAPCELVCPVAATAHDAEGLNLQIYNRCVGTRYCSNNCPYKVRRFNFLEYNNRLSPSEKLVKNPDVTVRSRGVMEKCTYCIQRINAARINAELEERDIREGEVVPACAQACPVEAIIFGNMNDRGSKVTRWKKSPLNYWMLGELNTRPRTSYFAKLRNTAAGLTT